MTKIQKSDELLVDEALRPIRREFALLVFASAVSGIFNMNVRDAGFCPISLIQSSLTANLSHCQRIDGMIMIFLAATLLIVLLSYRAWKFRGLAISFIVGMLFLLLAAGVSYDPNGFLQSANSSVNKLADDGLIRNLSAVFLPVSFVTLTIGVTAWFSTKRV